MTWTRTSSYAVGLALAVALTACGSGDEAPGGATSSTSSSTSSASPSSSPSASSSSSTSATTPAGRTLEVTVTGSKVSPPPGTVKLGVGETLTLTVTRDHDDELHIHGFDVEEELPAGRPVSVELTGKAPGVYEVETHHPELRLLKIAVS